MTEIVYFFVRQHYIVNNFMNQISRDRTTAIVDGVIKLLAGGGFIATALLVPNFVRVIDKPFGKFLGGLDKRQRERELRRVLYYMKSRGLVRYAASDYGNGIRLTSKGKQRFKKSSYNDLSIPKSEKWDKKWRLVFFDVPEKERHKRNCLSHKLRLLGYQQLQYSIWIHPFESRAEIEAVCDFLCVRKYVSYVEITDIDSQKELKKRFKELF